MIYNSGEANIQLKRFLSAGNYTETVPMGNEILLKVIIISERPTMLRSTSVRLVGKTIQRILKQQTKEQIEMSNKNLLDEDEEIETPNVKRKRAKLQSRLFFFN